MKLIAAFCLLILLVAGCNKSEQGSLLDSKIRSFSKYACAGGSVTRYAYDQQAIYVFDDGCGTIDGGAEVTDGNGNQVCYLGGFAGEMNCLGKRFDTTAKNPEVIFRK